MTALSPRDLTAWQSAFASTQLADTFAPEISLNDLWIPLREAANAATDPTLAATLLLLSRVSSMYTRPDDWQHPYGPAVSWGEERSTIATDLVDSEVQLLHSCVEAIPNSLLKSRVYDVLSLRAPWEERIGLALASIDTLLEVPISGDGWAHEEPAWNRAIKVAVRYGEPAASRLRRLEQSVRGAIRVRQGGFLSLRAADLLRTHNLARDRASTIAGKLERVGAAERANLDRSRAYYGGAATWYEWAGDIERAHEQKLLIVNAFMQEADIIARESDGAMRSAHLLENALRALRTIPRAERTRMGVTSLSVEIARRIRESGAASLGTMRAFTSERLDLTNVAKESRERVAGESPLDALMLFATLQNVASFTEDMQSAEALINTYPLQSLFTTVTFSNDGRVINRSSGRGGTPIYGVDPATWKQMMRAYSQRIGLVTAGMIFPAYTQLTNEHHLTMLDFARIVSGAGIVPSGRIRQFTTGLFLGYDGDFSTALQLLSPQVEHLVRHHLGNAGVVTTTISSDGIENEKGMSALMESTEVNDIFGVDLAYEIRALFCSPLGPNLRNEVAHGLLNDETANSANALYAWWFVLRLILTHFWNSIHDTEAADAREPSRPSEQQE